MRQFCVACFMIALTACARFSGARLEPGVATEADVEKSMGPSADRRQRADGEVVRYYSRLPAGRAMYAARFGRDGKLIAIEQRLTREAAASLVPGKSTSEDVRELLGPPYRVENYPKIQSEVWLYPMQEGAVRFTLNVDFAAGGILREARIYNELQGDLQ